MHQAVRLSLVQATQRAAEHLGLVMPQPIADVLQQDGRRKPPERQQWARDQHVSGAGRLAAEHVAATLRLGRLNVCPSFRVVL